MKRIAGISYLFIATLAVSACGGGQDSSLLSDSQSTATAHVATRQAAPADYATVVQQLYIAYFGRPADSAGLESFKTALNSAQAPTDIQGLVAAYATNAGLRQLIDSFGTSAESQRLYSGDTASFVTAIFNNVLNRPPQTAGLNFWVDSINSGSLTRGNAALSIMSGALVNQSEQGLIDAALVNKKVAIGTRFTSSLTTAEQINSYRGSTAATTVRTMLSAVNGQTDADAFQTTIDSTLGALQTQAFASSAGIYDINYGQFSGVYTFLDNGRFYGVHFVSGPLLAGHPRGLLSPSNATTAMESIAWANFIDDGYMVGAQEAAGKFGRTYDTKLNVKITGSMGTFTASATTQKAYFAGSSQKLYSDPIPMATIAGNYSGYMRTVGINKPMQNVTDFVVAANGSFNATAAGCTFSGQMSQHGTTGVFDVQATVSGASCTMTPSLSGIVTPLSVNNSLPQLAFQMDSADDKQTAVFIVTKK